MSDHTGPELSFGAPQSTAGTAQAPAVLTPEEAGRRGARILLFTGVGLTVLSLIVMFTAGSDASVSWRGSDFGTWVLLLPSLVAVLGGAYGMASQKAYGQENAARGFTGAAVTVTVIVLFMTVKAFA